MYLTNNKINITSATGIITFIIGMITMFIGIGITHNYVMYTGIILETFGGVLITGIYLYLHVCRTPDTVPFNIVPSGAKIDLATNAAEYTP